MTVPSAAMVGVLLALGLAAARRRGQRTLVLVQVIIGMVAILALTISGIEQRAVALMSGTVAFVVSYVLSDITSRRANERRTQASL